MFRTASNISNALRQQRKSIALAELRFKKHLEDLLSKRLGSLHNLESTLISVETAAGDVEVSSFSLFYTCALICVVNPADYEDVRELHGNIEGDS